MAKFTKISNGYTLEIEIDEARLLTEIDEYINEMQELKKEITDRYKVLPSSFRCTACGFCRIFRRKCSQTPRRA